MPQCIVQQVVEDLGDQPVCQDLEPADGFVYLDLAKIEF